LPITSRLTLPDPFDDSRGRLVLEYFISHFIAMAKKSNEFSCHGQSFMYIKHADNLMRLMKELKYYGTNAHMGYETELEQLKQARKMLRSSSIACLISSFVFSRFHEDPQKTIGS
jgi:hypothetical protein